MNQSKLDKWAKMAQLPNNCRRSKYGITPKDWQDGGSKLLGETWRVRWRFYDDNTGKTKEIKEEDFNRFGTVGERRSSVATYIESQEALLYDNGWNPIERTYTKPLVKTETGDITKYTPVAEAYEFARKKLKVIDDTMTREVQPQMRSIKAAIIKLGYQDVSIWDFTLKNVFLVAEQAAITSKGAYSADKYNRIRKVLDWLYKILIKLEVAQANYARSLDRQKAAPLPPKKEMPAGERKIVNDHLLKTSRRFWLFIRIFWHVGSRATELLRVQRKHVDFGKGIVTCLTLKGAQYEYVEHPMVDASREFWIEACAGAGPDDYIFSFDGLNIGPKPATKNAIKLRWERLEDATGIKGGMYRLKHTHTTAVKKKIGTAGAALLNAESEEMIKQVYDLDHEKDEMDAIRKVHVPFV